MRFLFLTTLLPMLTNPQRSLKFYDPSTFWKMDWKQGLADLPYVLFGIYFSREVANDAVLFRSLSPLHLLQVFVLVSIFLPLYLGFVYAKYKIVYPKFVSRLVILFALFGFLIQLMFLGQLNIRSMEASDGEAYVEYFFLFMSLFMLFLIPAAASGGFKMGRKIFGGESTLKPERHLGNLFAVVLGISLFLFQFIYFLDEERPMGWRWLVFFLEISISIFAANRFFAFLRFVKRKIEENNKYHRAQQIFETAFPFIITSVLLIWSQVATRAAGKVIGEGDRPVLVIIFALILSGVIPFRLFLLFNPPLRFINLLAGIASFSFFLWSIS